MSSLLVGKGLKWGREGEDGGMGSCQRLRNLQGGEGRVEGGAKLVFFNAEIGKSGGRGKKGGGSGCCSEFSDREKDGESEGHLLVNSRGWQGTERYNEVGVAGRVTQLLSCLATGRRMKKKERWKGREKVSWSG